MNGHASASGPLRRQISLRLRYKGEKTFSHDRCQGEKTFSHCRRFWTSSKVGTQHQPCRLVRCRRRARKYSRHGRSRRAN
ncbi:hypothetical protein NXT3_PC00684 (plasmid) [Sinorhizobium fredii]|uniref:Uncharacterized protein n=1 Tax=Rhizobium fredii TaxID=380 RepID=A0A2L0HEG1_RHIFR|nr:hypothetical protein NXT3_PC00684 [Sinorhizobium fredii]